jgi:hypothetical protein
MALEQSPLEIPKGDYDTVGSCWIPQRDFNNRPSRPLIKCRCGDVIVIPRHHVHSDGRITKSFYHHVPKCGWDEWVRLKDYDQGEFRPER